MQVLYPRCAGLDVHQQTVVACARELCCFLWAAATAD